MPVPSTITDLNVTASSNYPGGSEAIGTSLDEYLRAIQSIVRREQAQGASIPSASTVNIGSTTDGNYVHITGTTTITSFGTVAAGISRTVVFDGALTITHNATSLILPGAANIITAAKDVAEFASEGSGNWRCVRYMKADGAPLVYNIASTIHAATSKATPVDADEIPLIDSAASFGLKKLTWANLKATLQTVWDARYAPISVQTTPPVRQTVLSGPVDSNGFAAFGGSTGSTTVTASGTLKATAAAGGDANYTGSITNPSWTGLSTNGTMYLYLDITSAGVVTTGSVTLATTYQWGGTYSTTNNQHTFNIQEMTMKAGNGSAASQVYRVFVGEVTVSGGVVTAITWYALMGRYNSGRFSVSSSTTYSKAHNLGVQPLNYRLLGASSAGAALVPVVLFSTGAAASANVGASIRADTGSGRLSMTIDSLSLCALPNGRDGNNQQASVTMVEMVAIAERGW